MPNPVNWFEIPVTDLQRAKAFYEAVLGYELSLQEMGPMKMAWFPAERGAPFATGSLVQAESYTPSRAGSIVYFSTPSIERALEAVEGAGGAIINGKTPIGEFGFVAHFEDSEGNRVALHADT